jgi:hypothetical protein
MLREFTRVAFTSQDRVNDGKALQARNVVDAAGIHQARSDSRFFEQLTKRNPIRAGGFRGDGCDMQHF